MKSFLILHQDLLLSLLGYVAAALGGALAASGIGSRPKTSPTSQANPSTPRTAVKQSKPASRPIVSTVTAIPDARSVNQDEATQRRNRQETLSLAREMLARGASHERIRQVLPVSDGELILLQKTPNHELVR